MATSMLSNSSSFFVSNKVTQRGRWANTDDAVSEQVQLGYSGGAGRMLRDKVMPTTCIYGCQLDAGEAAPCLSALAHGTAFTNHHERSPVGWMGLV